MAKLHVVRVFVGPGGTGGNPLGVFLDGVAIPKAHRQAISRHLGFSETVFVDDIASGMLQIFTPMRELPFAGHPLVGVAWLLQSEGHDITTLNPPAGAVATWTEEGQTWIRADPRWSPRFQFLQLDDPAQIDALQRQPPDTDWAYTWAWEDEPAGHIRARCFISEESIPEDEATGSAAAALVGRLGRRVEIRQGAGSLIRARPGPVGAGREQTVEVGGAVQYVELREHQGPSLS